MGTKYRQLTLHDRVVIENMLSDGCSKARIAKHLHVDLSTIYREIKRNTVICPRQNISRYLGYFAHEEYLERRQKQSKLERHKPLKELVHRKLKQGWSPWQIEWHLKKEATDKLITHETIYRYIYSHWERRCEFTPHLRRVR